MSKAWHPKNWEKAGKRNVGRNKLHQREQKKRADRMTCLIGCINSGVWS
jgi:hypothetical protein